MPSWFVVAAVVTVLYAPQVARSLPDLGGGAFVVSFVSALLLLLSVFLHELAHAVAARAVGTAPTHIALDLWGGHTAFEGEFASPGRSAFVSVVGPATNLALALLGWSVHGAANDGGAVQLLLYAFVFTNGFVAAFNALPGLPLDGGRVLEALVWRLSGSRTAGTITAGWVGRAVAVGLVVVAVVRPLVNGQSPQLASTIWVLLVAGLLWQGATQAIRVARWRRRAPTVTVRALLRPAVSVPETTPLAEALAASTAARSSDVVLLDGQSRPTAVLDAAAAASVPADRAGSVESVSVARALAPDATVDVDLGGEALIQQLQRTPHPEYAVLDASRAVVGVLAWDVVAADVARH
jgi:Zn-dependent protease